MSIQTAGATALTLDSSQNATFAGQVSVGNYSIPSDHQFQIAHLSQAYARFGLTNSLTGNGSSDGLKFQMEGLNSIIKNNENGYFAFGTNGRETDLRIDSSGKVGIGNDNPSDYGADANNLVVGSLVGNNGITILSTATNGYGSIYFADGTTGSEYYSGYISYQQNQSNMSFGTNGAERMRIDSSGNVGIGTDSPDYELQVGDGTATETINIKAISTNPSRIFFSDNNAIGQGRIHYEHGGDYMNFWTDNTERMRIDSSGTIISTIDGSTSTANKHIKLGGGTSTTGNGQYIQFSTSSNAALGSRIEGTREGAGGSSNLKIYTTDTGGSVSERMRITSGGDVFSVSNTSGISSAITAGAGTSLAIFIGKHSATNGSYASGTNSFIVWSNGNVVNTNNSYGAISDAKLKENIVDTTPKLDDLMKVKVRNYNLIGDDKKQIGVVAQELEEVFPAMIDESIDYEDKEITDEEGNISTEKVDLGTTTKSVKYSVFVPMLIKSIQELKAEVDKLKQECKCKN